MGTKKNNLGVRIAMAVIGIAPVSYTHLDVYKRQLRQCGGSYTGFQKD